MNIIIIIIIIFIIRYPTLQNADLDQETDDGDIVPGAWRNHAMMHEMQIAGRAPRETREGKQLRTALKHYYCSEAGSVPWQEAALNYNY